MEQTFGIPREQAIRLSIDDIPFMRETGEAARIKAGFDGQHIQTREFPYRIPGAQKESFYESLLAPLQNHTGTLQGAVLRIRDITERKWAEEQLHRASLYARSLIEADLDPLVTISVDGKIMDSNAAAARDTGVPREQMKGSDFSEYFTDPDSARAGYREAFTKGAVRNYPLTMRHVSGKLTEVLYNASVYHSEKGEVAGVLAVARDITERRRAEQAEELARRDGLTDLYNHRTLYELLKEEILRTQRSNRPVSLLMLDIDYFKRVNDTLGHDAGDMALKGLGQLLMKQVRAIDHVCRYGGDEFTVILPEGDTAVAMQIAERLRAEVQRQPFDIGGGKTISVTVSIGVATYTRQLGSPEEFIKAADIALYAAKQAGRDQVSRYDMAMSG